VLLAGDIGGTKTTLTIFTPESGPRAPVAEATFPSGQYASLEALVGAFLGKVDLRIERASFGVAGPVVRGEARITNLPWHIEEKQLREALSVSWVRLLNDLQAIAHAVPELQAEDLYTLNAGQPERHGALGVIAPGTGLGEAFLTWQGEHYRAHASEGGHSDFAPTTPAQIELLRYLHDRLDHVSYERVCSGIGLPNIYAYLKDSGYAPEPAWLAERLAAADDATPIIVNTAVDAAARPAGEPPCALCMETVSIFTETLGAEAGNLALTVMATGGIFVGGGIPPRILEALSGPRFMAAFRHKGRFAALLSRVPVQVIRNPRVALLGAAYHCLEAAED
jgi:glucokinase